MLTPPVFKSPSVKFFPINFCRQVFHFCFYILYLCVLVYCLLVFFVFLLDVPLEENDCNDSAGALLQLQFGGPGHGEDKEISLFSWLIVLFLTIVEVILYASYSSVFFGGEPIFASVNTLPPLESGDISIISTDINLLLEENVPKSSATFLSDKSLAYLKFVFIPALTLLGLLYLGAPPT